MFCWFYPIDATLKTFEKIKAGLSVRNMHTQINFPRNRKGCDKLETKDKKLSARRFHIFLCQVFIIIFWPPIFQNMQKQGPNTLGTERIKFASSNALVSRSQILLRCLGSFGGYFFSYFRKTR